MLPGNFELLEEARGIEGQLGYNIIPKDSSSTAFGFIEIQHGRPIGDNSRLDKSAKLFAKSYLSDKKVNWTIYKTETGYFIAFTTEDGDINANVSSKKRTEIDSLISIIATLKER